MALEAGVSTLEDAAKLVEEEAKRFDEYPLENVDGERVNIGWTLRRLAARIRALGGGPKERKETP
jgi:hypothetical protein